MEAAESDAHGAHMQRRMLRIVFVAMRYALLGRSRAKVGEAMRQRHLLRDQQRERQKDSAEKTGQGAHVRHIRPTLQAATVAGIWHWAD